MFENYISSGYCHQPTPEDPRRGAPELVLYNPTAEPSEATLTVYFADRPPHTFEPVRVKPETNELLVMPRMAPEVFEDCGFWGLKVESPTPLMLNFIGGTRIAVERPKFRGGCTNFHGTKLHKEWHFPDGLWLEWNKFYNGDLSKAPFPFNELGYYYLLNPNPEPAEVAFTLRYKRLPHETINLTIPAERVLVWDNLEKVPFNQGYTVKVVSSVGISASAVRYIYGLRGLDEWGMTVHGSMYGIPGPIEG